MTTPAPTPAPTPTPAATTDAAIAKSRRPTRRPTPDPAPDSAQTDAIQSQDRQQALRDDIRFRLLNALADDPSLSQRGLARSAGVSLGAANAKLNRLIAAGFIKIGNAEPAPGRFRLAYRVTKAGATERARLAPGYLARRQAEHAALAREIAALTAAEEPRGDPA